MPEHVGLQTNPFTVHAALDLRASYVKVRATPIRFKWIFFVLLAHEKNFFN